MYRKGICQECGGPSATWEKICYNCRDAVNQRDRILVQRLRPHHYPIDASLPTKLYAVSVIGDDDGPVKFGTSNDPQHRLADIQCGCPYPLEILATIGARRGVERLVHRYLHVSRLHGEWFGRTEKSDKLIAVMRVGDPEKVLEMVRLRLQRKSAT